MTTEIRKIEVDDTMTVSPALAHLTNETILGDLWKRDVITPRDRSLVTVASLIQRSQPIELARHIALALDNGVTPAELSETITQLAFYSGLANGTAAVAVARQIFTERGIGQDQLAPVKVELLVQDADVEANRVKTVEGLLGPAFGALADYTTNLLFGNVWLRPTLSPRDRCLVTMTALITANMAAQIGYHVNKAMDNGMTEQQVAEVITHIGFYAGWPNAMNAANVAKDLFAKRSG
jgi:4-carboxymuconolactone decarboxylase